ncbi:Transcription termination factor nusG, partial [Ruminococcaceae bacterium P7]
MTKHKWYVLQVRTGYEEKIAAELNSRGYAAVVPLENRLIRRGGKWQPQPYIVFSGYVFVYLDYSWAQYYAMAG